MNQGEICKELNRALLLESEKNVFRYTNSSVTHKHNCTVPGCERKAISKKLCNAHYIRKRHGLDISSPIKNRFSGTECTVCGKRMNGKGGWRMCPRHYKSARFNVIKGTLINIFGGKCFDCKVSYANYVYDFHHLRDKKHSIALLLVNGKIEEISSEIIKCVLLCSNCHRIRHGEKHEAERNNSKNNRD